MGRLQKKKTSRKKKKQDQNRSAQPNAVAAEKTTSLAAVSSKDVLKKEQSQTQKKQAGPVKALTALQKRSFVDKALQFLREVKVELKKVTWPTRKQTIGSTLVVIIIVMIISLFLGIVDIGLSSLIRVVLQ